MAQRSNQVSTKQIFVPEKGKLASVASVGRKGIGVYLFCSLGWKEGHRGVTFLFLGLEERA